MLRNYIPKPGTRQSKNYDKEVMEKAIGRPKACLKFHKVYWKGIITRKISSDKEGSLPWEGSLKNILLSVLCFVRYGAIPWTNLIVKAHLVRRGIQHKCSQNNMPGRDWVDSFLKRNKHLLARRMCQNINRSRNSAISPEVVNDFFDNLRITLKDVPPGNIMNYNETNLCNNPRKKVISKTRLKTPGACNELH